MIALCLACALATAGIRAQSNSNSSYQFRQQSVVDGQSINHSPVPILTMDCLAANGYGQWTLSSSIVGDANYPPGWYLLANGLYVPCTGDANNQCVPPGVVQNAAPAGGVVPTEPEATANLDGGENFLWPDGTRANFVVQGFWPTEFDLGLSFLWNPEPPMNFTNPIVSFPSIPTDQPTGTPHNVVTTTPYQDEFDVASDAAYLYITWCSSTNLSPNIVGSEIWATVVDINTMAVVPGFPMSLGQGERPTIACDPRNNRSLPAAPVFEVAYLTGHTSPSSVKVAKYNAGLTVFGLAQLFNDPSCSSQWGYDYVTHARILVTSVLSTGGVEQPTTDALYAIVEHAVRGTGQKNENPQGFVNTSALIEYTPVLAGPAASYVDGQYITPKLPVPPNNGGYFPGWPVLDHPIVALSNPYDEQDYPGVTFNQFHCLYQLDLSQDPGQQTTEMYPLLIVRGRDNGTCATTDERLVLNQEVPVPITPELMSDPNTYCAAVNQMGIHVHWRAPAVFNGPMTHYYARDTSRTFDEPIDENTLVTDQCKVSDGTAHGGTVGATIIAQPYEGFAPTMAVWTDPNYGPPSKDGTSGLYTPRTLSTLNPYVGTLNFSGTGVTLNVGDPNGGNDGSIAAGGQLSVMPYFYFNFPGSNQGVHVNKWGYFDYNGLLTTHDNLGNPLDSTTPFTDGTADGAGGGTIKLAYVGTSGGEIDIRGGANLNFGPNGRLVSDYGTINVALGTSMYPTTTGTPNPSASGLITMLGKGTVSNSTIDGNYQAFTGNPPTFLQQYILHITYSTNPTYPSPFPQWTSDNNTYEDPYSGGVCKIRIEGNPGGTDQSELFSGDNFDGVVIIGVDMHNSMNIENCTFDNSIDPAIWLQQASETEDYGIQWITGNTFGKYTFLSTSADEAGQIEFQNFQDENFNWLQVNTNSFTTNNGQDHGAIENAIELWRSTGTVSGNTIDDIKYDQGIEDDGHGRDDLSHSLICDNSILSTSPSSGLFTQDYDGYVKWNEITGSGDGYFLTGFGTSHVVFNYIHDNRGVGINGYSVDLDMSGVHHSFPDASPGDLPGYNTVINNRVYQIETSGNLWLGQGSNELGTEQATYTAYGDNNIELGNSSILVEGNQNAIARSIDNNYWVGLDPNTQGSTYWPNFLYDTPVPNWDNEANINDIKVSCGNDTIQGRANGKIGMPLGQSADSSLDSCNSALALAMNYSGQQKWQLAYDTIRWFFDHCYMLPNTSSVWNDIFGDIQEGVLVYNHAPWDSVLAMRSWLMSIRNLPATDPAWYCDVVFSITSTYPNAFDQLAITKFLIDNPHCPGDAPAYDREYNSGMQDTFMVWAVHDPHPNTDTFDSTLPSLHDLGLDSLLGDAAGVGYTASGSQIILDARITTNPFPQATALAVSIGREAYLHVQVYDLLGREVESAGYSGTVEQGSRVIPLDLSNSPPGSYYVRIATANNEVRTLKITKE